MITIESLTENLKKLDQDMNNYVSLTHQCMGAIKLIQSQLELLKKEESSNGQIDSQDAQ